MTEKVKVKMINMQSFELDRDAIYVLVKEAIEARLVASGMGVMEVANLDFLGGDGGRVGVKKLVVNMMHTSQSI